MELSFTYYLLVTSIVIFSLYIIEKSQIGVYLNVHKIFILVLIFINVPIILIKPDLFINDPSINYRSLIYPDEPLVLKGVKIFLSALLAYALTPFIFKRFFTSSYTNFKETTYTRSSHHFNIYCIVIFIFFLILTLINLEYRLNVVQYIMGDVDPAASNLLRRFYDHDFFIIKYFRYSILLIHIIMFSYLIKSKYGNLAFTIVYLLSLVLISGSVTKLYYVHSIAIYFVVLLYSSEKKNILENKNVYLKSLFFSILLILLLAILYSSIQYAQLSFFEGLKAAVYRVFSSWTAFLYFVYIFPDFSDFTYLYQSSFLGNIFGFEPTRIGDILVKLHPRLFKFYTSLVSNYIGYAWAFGGYFAVIIFSILISFLLKYLDVLYYFIKNETIRVTFFSFVICLPISNVHSSFFSSMLHYGMLSGPLYLIILDKIFSLKKND